MSSAIVTICSLLVLLGPLLTDRILAAQCACEPKSDCCCSPDEECEPAVFGAFQFVPARRAPHWQMTDFRLARTDPFDFAMPAGRVFTPDDLLAAAEATYTEATQHEWRGASACVDGYFHAAMLSWRCLKTTRFELPPNDAPPRAWGLYHSSLARLLVTGQQFGRLDPRQGLRVGTPTGLMTVGIRHQGFPWQPGDFRGLILVGNYREPSLTEIHRRPGLGVPLVVIRHGEKKPPPGEQFVIRSRGFAATAVLRPAGPWQSVQPSGQRIPVRYTARQRTAPPYTLATLELYNPLQTNCVEIETQSVPLTSDISAPIAMGIQGSQWQPLQEYLRPDTDTEATLIMVEPYQRGRIPLLFVHGLLSDPRTYLDIANEIRADPYLNARFQIWGFSYPTGGPFLHSASRLRTLLSTAIGQCRAACGDDPALDHTVIVGHSMGGLITKLQVTTSGNVLWNSVAKRPLDELIVTEKTRKEIADLVYFRPLPFVDRVVMIATPHDGSPWAGRLIGRLAGKLVNFSEREDQEHQAILRNNPGAFNPTITDGFPTSVEMLKEDNPILAAERQLEIDPRVTVHSIIGTGHRLLCDGPADGVVPVASARHPGADSEAYIDAVHTTILRNRATVRELKRILHAHLAQSGGAAGPACQTASPLTASAAHSAGN